MISFETPSSAVGRPTLSGPAVTRLPASAFPDPPAPPLPRRWAAATPWVVWSFWAFSLAILLGYVVRYGTDMPFHDEWMWVPQVTGDEAVTGQWLWSQHNEHRLPLPRILYLGLLKISGNDFRSGMIFDVLCLGGLAAVMIVAARRVRGHLSIVDAFLPLAVLNSGQCENLLWNFQVGLVFPTLLAGFVLTSILGAVKGDLSLRAALVAGTCLILMSLCGAVGPAYGVPLGLWLCLAGGRRLIAKKPHARRDGLLLVVMGVLPILMAGVYFIGYVSPAHHPRSPSWDATALVAGQFLSTALGFAGQPAEKYWSMTGVLVAVVLLPTALLLAGISLRQGADKVPALGMLAFLSAVIAVAAGVGLGRAGLGSNAGFASRYTTLALPAALCVYFSWLLYGGRLMRRLMPSALCLLAAVLVFPNGMQAVAYGKAMRQRFVALERDIRVGLPCTRLGESHCGETGVLIGRDRAQLLAERMGMLKRARIGKFQQIQDGR